jgi:hypothetical protein
VFAINRDVTTHAQAVLILKEYQRRRERGRNRSLAEWYTIDPAFQKGFRNLPGEPFNGNISSIVGGELIRAALRYGEEAYAVDVMQRLFALRRGAGVPRPRGDRNAARRLDGDRVARRPAVGLRHAARGALRSR